MGIVNILKNFNLDEFILMLGIALLLVGTFFFWRGFHNLDIANNEQIIEYQVNNKLMKNGIDLSFTLTEYQLDGSRKSLTNVYLAGLKDIIKGLYISIFSAFLIGYYLCKLNTNKHGHKRN